MLHGRSDNKDTSANVDAAAPVCIKTTSNNNNKDASACNSRHHQHPTHTAGSTASTAAATAAGGGHHHCSSRQQHHHHQQLRPPPVRYAAAGATLLPQHQKWSSRGLPAEETTCTCVLPRTSVLCRLLVAMTVLLVFVQAVSCGMFFCVNPLPIISHTRGAYVDYQELVTDLSAPAVLSAEGQQGGGLAQVQLQHPLKAVPKLIPRVIHQTHRNGRLPASARAFMRTWAEVNGESWQVRFYSDEAALTFVRREFPEYFEAYLNLPKDVERADFFRYMVVLRLGGAYADIDAECRQPLDSIIKPADTLLVGWDTEVTDASSAAATGLSRQRLVANWFFVAAAGHPVLREVCDHIARNAMSTFSKNAVRDTAERTGQGVWTDLVLRHALQHKAAKHDDPWKVRILPRVAFGVRPVGDEAALRPDTPGVVVLHHFMSSWQTERHRRLMQALRPLLSWGRPSQLQEIAEPVLASNITHYPVSIAFNPPFTLMTDLIGLGDVQAAADVSATITAHGTWQPGVAPYRKPAVVEALVGALAKYSHLNSPVHLTRSAAASATAQEIALQSHGTADGKAEASSSTAAVAHADTAAASSSSGSGGSAAHTAGGGSSGSSGGSVGHSSTPLPGQIRGGVFVDVGAGQGFFSLAAAARGHRVVAFESSPASLAAFKASINYNGFQSLISIRSEALGASAGSVCLQQSQRHSCQAVAAATYSDNAAAYGSNRSRSSSNSNSSNSALWRQQEEQRRQAATAQEQLRRRRGYPWLSDGAAVAANHSCCSVSGSRLRLSDALQNVTDVAVLRISAHGHEGYVIQGAMDYLRTVQKPDVIYVEYWPAAMLAAGFSKPVSLLHDLFDLGYSDIAHAGRVCDERWQNATQTLHLQGSYSAGARMALQQPTWCKLRPEQFEVLATAADVSGPENVMFLLGQPAASAPHPSSGGSSSSGSVNNNSSSSGSSTLRPSHGDGSSSTAAQAPARVPTQPQQQVTGPTQLSSSSGVSRPLSGSLTGSMGSASSSSRLQPQQPL